MPELAEVEFFRRQWNPGLKQRVAAAELHRGKRIFRESDESALVSALRGATLLDSHAHGKQMLFRFSRGAWLGLHLGMTGEMRFEPRDFVPGKHDHFVLRQARQCLVFADARQFGRVRFHAGTTAPEWWTSLPPAVTSPGFTREAVAAFLHRRGGAPIKAVLLMQEAFPGVGNWMADEILWRAGIHPATRASRLAGGVDRIWKEVRAVANGAMKIVAPRFADPPETWLFPHRWKDGGKCPRDGEKLHRQEVGGRTTAWCRRCQPRGVSR